MLLETHLKVVLNVNRKKTTGHQNNVDVKPCRKVNKNFKPGRKETKKGKNKLRKPTRLCIYCNKYYSEKLSRHILSRHSDVERVQKAKKLPRKERDRVMSDIRREGIMAANKRHLKEDKPIYERERRTRCTSKEDELVICGVCDGFFSKKFFTRHKRRCNGDSINQPGSIPVYLLEEDGDHLSEFNREILSNLRNDEIGAHCRKDPLH
jgi:hypothetical protein